MRTLIIVGVVALLAVPASAQPRSFLYQLQNLDVAEAGASPFDVVVTDYSLGGSTAGKLSAVGVSPPCLKIQEEPDLRVSDFKRRPSACSSSRLTRRIT